MMIPINRAFHRNCNGEPIERWAWRNKTQICNMNGYCLSESTENKNFIFLHLARYDPSITSQKWKMDYKGVITNIDSFLCHFGDSSIVNVEKDYAKTPIVLVPDKSICISWSFVPIFNEKNETVCADFD